MRFFRVSPGFTLIEIMVVLSIIGVLSSVLYVSFGEVRLTSKNQTMRAELKEVQLALELYKAQYDQYPDAQDISVPGCKDSSGGIDSASSIDCVISVNPYIVGLRPDYIADLPSHTDSGNSLCEFVYQVSDAGDRYKLTARNCFAGAGSAAEGIQPDDELARCPSVCSAGSATCAGSSYTSAYVTSAPFYESFAIYSAGAECL